MSLNVVKQLISWLNVVKQVIIVHYTVDGGWSNWTITIVGQCSATCGPQTGSVQIVKKRVCNNPAPQAGGRPCVGNATETSVKSCNKTIPCPGQLLIVELSRRYVLHIFAFSSTSCFLYFIISICSILHHLIDFYI